MNIFSIIYLLGAAQGFLLVFVLIFRKNNVQSNRILALLLGLFSLNLLNLASREYDPAGFSLHTATFSFIYGPLIYFYVLSLTRRFDAGLKFSNAIHFLPFIIDLTINLSLCHSFYQEWKVLEVVFKIVQYAVYLTASLMILSKHESYIRNFFSEIGKYTLKWLRIMIILDFASLFIVMIILTLHFLGIYDIRQSQTISRVTFIISSLAIYIIGYFSMQQPEMTLEQSGREKIAEISSEKLRVLKYEKSRIDDSILIQYKNELTEYMEKEKPYLNHELTLQELADAVSLTYHELSQVINAGFGLNFYSYINNFRIIESERILTDPKRKNENILAVAYDSGFRNKSNFNTLFKKKHGITPSEYKKNQLSTS